jgi:hypothetical protein
MTGREVLQGISLAGIFKKIFQEVHIFLTLTFVNPLFRSIFAICWNVRKVSGRVLTRRLG